MDKESNGQIDKRKNGNYPRVLKDVNPYRATAQSGSGQRVRKPKFKDELPELDIYNDHDTELNMTDIKKERIRAIQKVGNNIIFK